MLRDAAFLNNSSAPYGLLSLQMTYTEHDARSILSSWSQEDARHAALSLYWDMGFAIAYGLFLSALTRSCVRGSSRFALVMAWVPIVAAFADLAENLCHLMLLGTAYNGTESHIGALVLAGFVFASTKWGLLASWSFLFLLRLVGTTLTGRTQKPG